MTASYYWPNLEHRQAVSCLQALSLSFSHPHSPVRLPEHPPFFIDHCHTLSSLILLCGVPYSIMFMYLLRLTTHASFTRYSRVIPPSTVN